MELVLEDLATYCEAVSQQLAERNGR
jgi:hypothetical protein